MRSLLGPAIHRPRAVTEGASAFLPDMAASTGVCQAKMSDVYAVERII